MPPQVPPRATEDRDSPQATEDRDSMPPQVPQSPDAPEPVATWTPHPNGAWDEVAVFLRDSAVDEVAVFLRDSAVQPGREVVLWQPLPQQEAPADDIPAAGDDTGDDTGDAPAVRPAAGKKLSEAAVAALVQVRDTGLWHGVGG